MTSEDSMNPPRERDWRRRSRRALRIRGSRAALPAAVVFALLGVFTMADDTAKQDPLLNSIEQLSAAKSMAENRVRLLRALVEDGELTKAKLRPIQVQYADARARVNASFDRILVELETTSGAKPTESFEDLARQASEEVRTFIETSDAVILGEDRSGAAAAAIEAAPGLFGSLVDIWKTLRGEKKAQRAALVARFEVLKWDAFDAVQ